MTFAISGTLLKVIVTCSGAMCSLVLPLWPTLPHSWPNKCRFSSLWSYRPQSLFINIPQIHVIFTNVSSSSPPVHLAKARGHSMSSYFQLLIAFGIVDRHAFLHAMLGSPRFHAPPRWEAFLPLPLLSLLCQPSPKCCCPLLLWSQSLYLLYLNALSRR